MRAFYWRSGLIVSFKFFRWVAVIIQGRSFPKKKHKSSLCPGPELNKYSSLFRLPCLSPLFHILICFFGFDFWMFLTHMKHLKSCSSTATSLGIFTKLRILRVACVGAKEIFVDLAYLWTINSAPSQLEFLGSREIICSSKHSIRTAIDLVSCWRFFGHGVQTQKTFESIFPSWRLDFPFLTLGSLSSSPRWAQ